MEQHALRMLLSAVKDRRRQLGRWTERAEAREKAVELAALLTYQPDLFRVVLMDLIGRALALKLRATPEDKCS